MAAESPHERLGVAQRVVGEVVVGIVEAVWNLRRDYDAQLVADLHVLRALRVGAVANVVEPSRLELRKAHAVEAAVGRRDAGDRTLRVVADAAHEERRAVQEDLVPPDIYPPHAEAFVADVYGPALLQQLDVGPVEAWALGRPRTELLERNAQRHVAIVADNGLVRIALDAGAHREPPAHAFDAADRYAHLGGPVVVVAAHPHVVQQGRLCRLQLNVAPDAAPALHGRGRPSAAADLVVGVHDDLRELAGPHHVGDLPLEGTDPRVEMADGPVVHKHPALRQDAADLDPYAPAPPGIGNPDVASVPALADIAVANPLAAVVLA